MSEEPHTLFVYHTDQRRRLQGCMPLFVFVSAILVVGGILLVPIKLTEKQTIPRTGRVYFRNDPLLHFNLRQMSPRPFELPKFVDPATKNFGRVDVPVLPESRLLWVEPPSPFDGKSDTFVLEGVDLLELPPPPAPPSPQQEETHGDGPSALQTSGAGSGEGLEIQPDVEQESERSTTGEEVSPSPQGEEVAT